MIVSELYKKDSSFQKLVILDKKGNFDRSGKRHAQVEETKPSNVQLIKTEKSVETATLLRNALKECDLLRRLETHHIEG